MSATVIPFPCKCTIRRAQPNDVEELLRMGRCFAAAARLPFHEPTMRSFTLGAMGNPNQVIYVAGAEGTTLQGMVVGALAPLYTDQTCLAATELAWWVEPEVRGLGIALQLLRAFETWGREVGATFVSVSAEAEMDGKRVGKLYEHAGYALRELTYVKQVRS